MAQRGHVSEKNPSVIRILAARNAAGSRGRNMILFLAVALGILTLTMVFGTAKGKMQAEYLRAVRRDGTAAATILEDGTKEQYVKIKELGYIEKAGRMETVGYAYNETESVCGIAVLDQIAWEEMMKPAYTDIQGHYPEEENEIMLPIRVLEQMGITEPRSGMKISLTVKIGLFEQREATFLLSGWYRDYTNPASHPAQGYVSEKKLRTWGGNLDEESDILICQDDRIDGHTAEEKLYEDVKMTDDAQTFTGGNTYAYKALNRFLGGYEMAVLGAFLVLAAVYFLIFNVLWISMTGDIRQIGLLHTLGATKKQLRSFYFRQIGIVFLGGTAVGAGSSWIFLSTWLPRVLGRQYLSQYGGSRGLSVFSILLLAGAILFVGIVTAAAAGAVVFRAVEMSCLEAMHYTGRKKGERSEKRRKKNAEKKTEKNTWKERREIRRMAWQNLFRTRGRLIWTVLSLFLGLETTMGAVVITEGTDYGNVFDNMPDFVIAGRFAPWAEAEGWGKEYLGRDPGEDPFLTEGSMTGLLSENAYDEFSPVSEEVKNQLLKVTDHKPENVHLTEGAYMDVCFTQTGIRPLVDDPDEAKTEQMIIETGGCTIQILTGKEIEQLKAFAEEQSLKLDMEALEEGFGVLLLQDHILSKEKQKQAEEAVGEPVWFTSLRTKEEREKESAEMTLCGYMDTTLEGFPELKQTWHGPRLLYFAISEKGFEKLQTEKKTFSVEMNVQEGEEVAAEKEVQQILFRENQIREEKQETGLFQISKQILQKEAEGYVNGSRLLLGALGAILLLAGIMNYFNVMAVGILTRQKEFAVLESLGMTKRQQRRMLVNEGVAYFILTLVLLAVPGIPGLLLLSFYMESRLDYFVFQWPVAQAAVVLGGLLILCAAMPTVICRYAERKK